MSWIRAKKIKIKPLSKDYFCCIRILNHKTVTDVILKKIKSLVLKKKKVISAHSTVL